MSLTVLEVDERTIADCIAVFLGDGREIRGRYARSEIEWDRDRREVYSYGRWFPLFRFVPGRLNGARDVFVLNGDTVRSGGWGNRSRTPDHQSIARRLIADTGVESVVIPFSALTGAGIEIDSIRPVHVRPDAMWTETRTARTLEEVPRHSRTVRVEVRRESRAIDDLPWHMRRVWRDGDYVDATPDADGFFRWTGSEELPLEPRADGLYAWNVWVHRLGDALFSAVRPEVFERPARAFESGRDDRRARVDLTAPGSWDCSAAPDLRHESGPGAACIHCGAPLTARVESRARARYLSSFDTNETPALYFLARVPRGAGDTVESALDSLAPRAVHAALARGREVRRQGDVFFVDTDYSRDDLAARGATFARLTLWTRDARPRKGEPGYRPAPGRAARRRELRYARRLWRERFRAAVGRATSREISSAAPVTGRGARRRYALQRERARADVELARAELARIVGRPYRDPGRAYYRYWLHGPRVQSRNQYASQVRRARESLEHAERRLRDACAARVVARDGYRRLYGANAAAAWTGARQSAAERFRPNDARWNIDAWRARRERARRAVSIYGTAHSATEVARVNGSVYVRGVVRHVPELEPGRNERPDHRPVTLTPGRWYLAVRNTVPRQSRRRARAIV